MLNPALIRTREHALKLFHIKGARGLHASLRAQGRVPGDEGRAAIARNKAARLAAKQLLEDKGRQGQANVAGI